MEGQSMIWLLDCGQVGNGARKYGCAAVEYAVGSADEIEFKDDERHLRTFLVDNLEPHQYRLSGQDNSEFVETYDKVTKCWTKSWTHVKETVSIRFDLLIYDDDAAMHFDLAFANRQT